MWWILLVGGWRVSKADSSPILWRDIRVVDARGDQGIHDVWIQDGRIAGLNPSTARSGRNTRRDRSDVDPWIDRFSCPHHQHPGAWLADIEDHETAGIASIFQPLAWGHHGRRSGLRHPTRTIQALSAEYGGPDIQLIGPLVGPKHGIHPPSIQSWKG